MESCIYLTVEEYEELKRQARLGGIPYENDVKKIPMKDGPYIINNIKINMKELKLRICEQEGISLDETIHFY